MCDGMPAEDRLEGEGITADTIRYIKSFTIIIDWQIEGNKYSAACTDRSGSRNSSYKRRIARFKLGQQRAFMQQCKEVNKYKQSDHWPDILIIVEPVLAFRILPSGAATTST